MMKKALVIGIDDYPDSPLTGCVFDAISMANILEKNGDGSPNYSVKRLTSNELEIDSGVLQDSVEELFSSDAETALLYFAGHGTINPKTSAGYLVSQDGRRGALGMSFADVLALANKASPNISSTIIILDSCQSGGLGEVPSGSSDVASVLGTGVTILTACHRDQLASEVDGQGVFTSILLDGLSGGASDILGRITPASVYAHIDQTLGAWEQRPVYKANVQTFVTLRNVEAKGACPISCVSGQNVPKEFRDLPVDEDNVRVFKDLQLCNRHSLVVPVGAEHMYYAAIESKTCKLTALGGHYRKLAKTKRL
jgi:hypothetical protein